MASAQPPPPTSEGALPAGGERSPPGGERSPPSGERFPPSGERFPPSGERFPPGGERLMSDGLFALLRFLRGEFERALEHADLHLEGVDELDDEGKEISLEVGQALLEGLEFTRGYLLDAFAALGSLRTECASLPTPGGERTVAALVLTPAELALPLLELEPGEEVYFDGVYAYLHDAAGQRKLWAEIGERPLPASEAPRGKLPVVR